MEGLKKRSTLLVNVNYNSFTVALLEAKGGLAKVSNLHKLTVHFETRVVDFVQHIRRVLRVFIFNTDFKKSYMKQRTYSKLQ